MANEEIGKIKCPVCGHEHASVRLSTKRRAYIVCEECAVQIFCRGIVSDQKVRAAMVKTSDPAQSETTMPAADPAQVKTAKVKVTRHTADGETTEEESTLFDVAGRALGSLLR